MSNLKLAVAVMDIGTTGVRILVGRITDKGTPKIIAKAETPSSGVIDLSGDLKMTDLNRCVSSAVDTVLNKTGIEIKSCYVSISNRFVRPVFGSGEVVIVPPAPITGLNVGEVLNEASNVVYGEDEMLVDIIPVAFRADDKLLFDKPEGTVCSRLQLEANAVVAKADVVARVTRLLGDLNIKVDGFVPSFFASQKVFDASAFFLSKDCFTVIADVGGASTEISVYYNGIPFAFDTLPMGGNNISRDLEKVFSVPENKATRMKFEYGYASRNVLTANAEIPIDRLDAGSEDMVEVSYVVDVMNARIEEIAQSAFKMAKDIMARSGIFKPVIDKIYFIGDGIVNFKGIGNVLESVIDAGDVEAVDKGKDLGIKTSFTTALGMLIYISSKIKYGRRPSTVINRNETGSGDKADSGEKEGATFGEKTKSFFGGVKTSVKNFFEKLKS